MSEHHQGPVLRNGCLSLIARIYRLSIYVSRPIPPSDFVGPHSTHIDSFTCLLVLGTSAGYCHCFKLSRMNPKLRSPVFLHSFLTCVQKGYCLWHGVRRILRNGFGLPNCDLRRAVAMSVLFAARSPALSPRVEETPDTVTSLENLC